MCAKPAALPSSHVPLDADLITLYSLKDLQASVARFDPTTGEKINKMRKHIGGKVKSLGISGKFKADEEGKKGELTGLVDPAWDNLDQDGKTWWQGQRSDAFLDTEDDMDLALGKLDAALGGIKAGNLPTAEHNQWKSLIALEETAPAKEKEDKTKLPSAPAVGKIPNAATAIMGKNAPANVMRNSAPASPRGAVGRPDRAGKKRRYDESSYEGYDEDGYSTGGDGAGRRGSGGGGKRQKRKVSRD
jgi:hypothetical protein